MHGSVLITVTGLPCSGKSTIAAEVSGRLRVPVFSRDDFREPVFDVFGASHEKAFSDKVGFVANEDLFLVIRRHMQVGSPVMIENIFHPRIYSKILRAMLEQVDFLTLQLSLHADGAELERRYRKRDAAGEKHPGHWNFDDYPYRHLFEAGGIQPLDLPGKVVKVDTTDLDAVDYGALADNVRDFVEGAKGART